jgi:excisionase family DNA binding protein
MAVTGPSGTVIVAGFPVAGFALQVSQSFDELRRSSNMAKMFYSAEEAAEKLGVSVDEVKELASTGKLQQFRDRDKLMFKREAVDALAGNSGTGTGTGADLEDVLDMAKKESAGDNSGSSDAIRISDQTVAGPDDDDKKKTGVSVFDADEVGEADPSAPTRMTTMHEESDTDLMIESVGSGSGLLDLTRESDDTSLGAELLDEIYPTTESSPAQDEDGRSGSSPGGSSPGSSGGGTAVFDSAINAEPSTSGLDNLAAGAMETPNFVSMGTVQELYDPVSSGLTIGALLAAVSFLGVGVVVAYGAVTGIPSVPQVMLANPNSMYGAIGGMLVVAIVFSGIGYGWGKLKGG